MRIEDQQSKMAEVQNKIIINKTGGIYIPVLLEQDIEIEIHDYDNVDEFNPDQVVNFDSNDEPYNVIKL